MPTYSDLRGVHVLARAGRGVRRFRGDVLVPTDDGYREAARTVFATGSPELILRPVGTFDVVTALRHAWHCGHTVSVRSGGHSPAGFSTHTSGMLVDLSRLNAVEVLDGKARLVRIGAGATWGEVARALAPHKLGLSAGDTNDVGVGGLTLGGGIGWMVRRYGVAIDSLVGADVVTADGRVLRADAHHHPDLFWALRGGGGNFGIVTAFDFIAAPVTSVQFGTISYQPDGLRPLLRGWRDLTRAGDERLTTSLTAAPPMMNRPGTLTLQCCYADESVVAAERALAPFRRLGAVIHDDVRAVSYPQVLQDAPAVPEAMRFEIRNAMLPDVSDDLVAAFCAAATSGPGALTLRSLGAAMSRVPRNATAFGHRHAEAMLVAGYGLPADAPGRRVRELWAPLAAHGRGAYVNFLNGASEADVAEAYPVETYRRLAQIKQRYDPQNIFRRNHNIAPPGA